MIIDFFGKKHMTSVELKSFLSSNSITLTDDEINECLVAVDQIEKSEDRTFIPPDAIKTLNKYSKIFSKASLVANRPINQSLQ